MKMRTHGKKYYNIIKMYIFTQIPLKHLILYQMDELLNTITASLYDSTSTYNVQPHTEKHNNNHNYNNYNNDNNRPFVRPADDVTGRRAQQLCLHSRSRWSIWIYMYRQDNRTERAFLLYPRERQVSNQPFLFLSSIFFLLNMRREMLLSPLITAAERRPAILNVGHFTFSLGSNWTAFKSMEARGRKLLFG